MTKIKFKVTPRKLSGKKTKQLRREEILPGNVYGVGGESMALQFPEKKFVKLYKEVGDTGVVYLQLETDESNKKDPQSVEKPTLIDEIQLNPVSGRLLHVSFKEVDLKEKIEAEVPIEMIGEFDVREAVLVQVKNSIVVEALPTDLPEKFEVNVEGLTEVGQSITLADLNFDKSKVSLVEVKSDEDWESPVVLVQEQRVAEVEEAAPEEAAAEDGEEKQDAEGEGQGQGETQTKETAPTDGGEKKG